MPPSEASTPPAVRALIEEKKKSVRNVVSTRGGGGILLNDGKGGFAFKAGPATDFLRRSGPYAHRAYASDFDGGAQKHWRQAAHEAHAGWQTRGTEISARTREAGG